MQQIASSTENEIRKAVRRAKRGTYLWLMRYCPARKTWSESGFNIINVPAEPRDLAFSYAHPGMSPIVL
jgi:hypothetical protein